MKMRQGIYNLQKVFKPRKIIPRISMGLISTINELRNTYTCNVASVSRLYI